MSERYDRALLPMNIKCVVKKIAADADMRERLLRACPSALDGYFLSESGEILTEEEINKRAAFTYFLDGLDFVANCVRS